MDTVEKKVYWSPLAKSRILYRRDNEYDEHFCPSFAPPSNAEQFPVRQFSAQLSGGMDSTAIVCISDQARRAADSTAKLLDTLSYYDDSEPHWDERVYFSITEMHRGKKGIHVDSSAFRWTFDLPAATESTDCFPGFYPRCIGKEELLETRIGPGGVPCDLVRNRRRRVAWRSSDSASRTGRLPSPDHDLPRLLSKALAWSLSSRSSMLQMLRDTLMYERSLYRPRTVAPGAIPPWIRPQIRDLCGNLLRQEDIEFDRRHLSPSSIGMGRAWYSILESQPHLKPGFFARRDTDTHISIATLLTSSLRVPTCTDGSAGQEAGHDETRSEECCSNSNSRAAAKSISCAQSARTLSKTNETVSNLCSCLSPTRDLTTIDAAVLSSAFRSSIKGAETRWNPLIKNAIDLNCGSAVKTQKRRPSTQHDPRDLSSAL